MKSVDASEKSNEKVVFNNILKRKDRNIYETLK